MLGGRPRLKAVYLGVARDVEENRCTQITQSDGGYTIVPIGHEVDGFEFCELIALTGAAAYYLVKHMGSECVLGIACRSKPGAAAFQLYDAAFLLFNALTVNLLPALRNYVGSAFSGRIYPYFDLSLLQIVRRRPLALRHINVYLQQLARFLQIGEQLDYSMGIFCSDTLFLSSRAPEALVVPEFGRMRKRGPNCAGRPQNALYEEDSFQLGACLYEMATGRRLLDHSLGEHSVMKQMIQLFGKQSALAWMPYSATVEASESYFGRYCTQLKRLSFLQSDRVLPCPEILLSPSPYDETAELRLDDRIVNAYPHLPGNSAPEFARFTQLLERLLGPPDAKYAGILEYLSAQSLHEVVEENRLEHD